MKDDERIQYLLWRNDRDVIRAKPKPKPPEKDKAPGGSGKVKPPFVDRVLKKAVEHLKKELEKKPAVSAKREA
jgi:hypothetical protein